jgi:hypothetical protein
MKKDLIILISLALIGSAIGYFVGRITGVSGWELFWEIFTGAALVHNFGIAFSEKEYRMLIGAVIGLLVSMSLDWIAGSAIDLRNKLSFMALCSFVGWGPQGERLIGVQCSWAASLEEQLDLCGA